MNIISRDDANAMYMNSIIQFENKLYIVDDLGSQSLLAREIGGNKEHVKLPFDADLLVCPTGEFRLGYFQINNTQAAYLARTPRRQYLVGWSERNIRSLSLAQVAAKGVKFVNNMLGKYLPFEDVVKQSRGAGGLAAFDRQFALEAASIIHYCGHPVGNFSEGSEEPVSLISGFEYLKPLVLSAMEKSHA